MFSNYSQFPASYNSQIELSALKYKQTQHVGVLSPVFINDLIRDKNIQYLEHLCALNQKININPIWFDTQTAQNKYKMLKIYQISVQYSNNTDKIYQNALSQVNQKVALQRRAVQQLKNQISQHKQETDFKKKKLKKQRLLYQRKKVRKYQQKMLKYKDQLIKKLQQQQQSQSSSSDSQHQPQQPQIVYVPMPYPPYHDGMHYLQPSPHAYHPHQASKYSMNSQNSQSNASLNPNIQNNTMNMQNNLYQQPSNGNLYNNNIPVPQPPMNYQQIPAAQQPQTQSNPFVIQDFSARMMEHIKKQSKLENKQTQNKKNKQMNAASNFTLSQSFTQKMQNPQDSFDLKEDSFKNNTGQFKQEDIFSSQTTKLKQSQYKDKVNQLEDFKNSKKDIGLAKKDSINSQFASDSIMDIHLGPQSNVDNNQHPLKNNGQKTKSSIVRRVEEYQLNSSNMGSKAAQPKFSQKNITFRDQQKEQHDSMKSDSFVLSTSKKYPNDNFNLLKSNQGKKQVNLLKSNQGSKQAKKLGFSEQLQFKNQINPSMADSMEDIESPRKNPTLVNSQMIEEQYEQDFEDAPQTPTLNINPPKKQLITVSKYLPLNRGYFILKNSDYLNPDNVSISRSDSLIGSLKQLTVRMSTAGAANRGSRCKQSSSKVSDFDLDIDMIQMPQNSRIARPSYDKKSTIRKTMGNLKIGKSVQHPPNPKIKGSLTSKKIQQNSKSEELISDKESKKQSNQNKILNNNITDQHHEKLADILLTQSHIMNHEQQQQDKKQNNDQTDKSLKLYREDSLDIKLVDEQKQKQLKKLKYQQRIQKLLKNRYKIQTDRSIHFDTMIIKKQIKMMIKGKENDYGYQDISEIYQQKIPELREKLKKVRQEAKLNLSQTLQKTIEYQKQMNKESSNNKLNDDQLAYSQSYVNPIGQSSTLKITPQKQFVKIPQKQLQSIDTMKKIQQEPVQHEKQSGNIAEDLDSIMPKIPQQSKITMVPKNSLVNPKKKQQQKQASKYALDQDKIRVSTSKLDKKNALNFDDEPEMALRKQNQVIQEEISQNDF